MIRRHPLLPIDECRCRPAAVGRVGDGPCSGKAAGEPPRSGGGSRKAFTLVEVMVVVTLISVLAMFSVPTFEKVSTKARTSVIVNDLRVFEAAFKAYAQESGDWPAEAKQGVVPAGMAGFLNEHTWTRTTPIGGKYNWEANRRHGGVRYAAAISIKKTKDAPLLVDVNQMLDIDRTIDDGNLETGRFQTGAGNVPLYIIQP